MTCHCLISSSEDEKKSSFIVSEKRIKPHANSSHGHLFPLYVKEFSYFVGNPSFEGADEVFIYLFILFSPPPPAPPSHSFSLPSFSVLSLLSGCSPSFWTVSACSLTSDTERGNFELHTNGAFWLQKLSPLPVFCIYTSLWMLVLNSSSNFSDLLKQYLVGLLLLCDRSSVLAGCWYFGSGDLCCSSCEALLFLQVIY